MARVLDSRWMLAACTAALLLAGGATAAAQEPEGDGLGARPGLDEGAAHRHAGHPGVDRGAGRLLSSWTPSATREFLQADQNVPSGRELGAIVRVVDEDHSWFALFTFSDEGYVDDSDKDAIDADALLASMKKGNEEGNAERSGAAGRLRPRRLADEAVLRSRDPQPDVGHPRLVARRKRPPSTTRCASSAAVA